MIFVSSPSTFKQRGTGAITQPINSKLLSLAVSPQDYGAVSDGNSHPLSDYYATLPDAQVVYPFATALSNQLDWAAFQAAINYCDGQGGGTVWVPRGRYMGNLPLIRRHPSTIVQGSGEGSESGDGTPCVYQQMDQDQDGMQFFAGVGQASNHYLHTRNICFTGSFTHTDTTSPFPVSTASGSGTVLTVTVTAHGLAMGNRIALRGLATSIKGGVFTVASVTNANVFTVASTATGSGAGGQMIKLNGVGVGLRVIGDDTNNNFYDQMSFSGVVVQNFFRGLHANRMSNSVLDQLTVQGCFDGVYLEGSINALDIRNCSWAANVNCGMKVLGGSGITMTACEGGNQPKQIYAENCNIGINKLGIESCTGDPWDGTLAGCAVECGTNGALIGERLNILAVNTAQSLIPFIASAAGSKIILSDSGMGGFNHSDMLWCARNNMFNSRKIRSDGLVQFFDAYDFSVSPLGTIGELACEAYFAGDEPTAIKARTGIQFLTIDTYFYFYIVLKTNATYTNWPIAGGPPPVANGTYTLGLGISSNGTETLINGRAVAIQEASA